MCSFRGEGNRKEKTAAFRECFFKIGDLRSLLNSGTPCLALTATATSEVKVDTLQGLGMKANTIHISLSPDRSNIYLYTKRVVGKNLGFFDFLIGSLKTEIILTPRTIVYCKSQKDCGKLFKHFKNELGEHAYYPYGASKVSKNMVIGMYHSNTVEKHKQRVSSSLFKNGGTCRVVFSTTALGMGVNFPDVHRVIHYVPPRHMEDFVQEIGRAGCNGDPGYSLLYFTGMHLRKCEKAIKNYATSDNLCLRKILLEKFGEEPNKDRSKHSCCINCHRQCDCNGPGCTDYIEPSGTCCVTSIPRNERNVQGCQKISWNSWISWNYSWTTTRMWSQNVQTTCFQLRQLLLFQMH